MTEDFNQAEFVAERFGGRQRLADALDVPYSRVRDWCLGAGFIPESYRHRCLTAADAMSIDLTPYDFIRHLTKVR